MVLEGVHPLHLAEGSHADFLKLGGVPNEPLDILSAHVGLALDEAHGLGRTGELREKESFNRVGEEVVLGFLAVVVHAISQHREVNLALFQKQVVLVVAVGINECSHRPDDFTFPGFLELLQKRSAEHLTHETTHDTFHLGP